MNESKPKHKKTETITAPVNTSPIKVDVTLNTSLSTLTKTAEAATHYSSLDDIQNNDIQSEVKYKDIQLEVKNKDIQLEDNKDDIQLEIKDDDIQLELPWDSVDSTTDSKIKPLMEDMVLPNVNIFIFHSYNF